MTHDRCFGMDIDSLRHNAFATPLLPQSMHTTLGTTCVVRHVRESLCPLCVRQCMLHVAMDCVNVRSLFFHCLVVRSSLQVDALDHMTRDAQLNGRLKFNASFISTTTTAWPTARASTL